MRKHGRLLLTLASLSIVVAAGVAYIWWSRDAAAPAPPNIAEVPKATVPPSNTETYLGKTVSVGGVFQVKVPNGWRASISTNSDFLAIMFARPNELHTLRYDEHRAPSINNDGIAAWSGLTEHFYILAPKAGATFFNPADHRRVSHEPFTFSNGAKGTRYYVVKDTSEAASLGGLQKDTEWQGRTFVQMSGVQTVEAHLAVYPSSAIDIEFYEQVVRSVAIE